MSHDLTIIDATMRALAEVHAPTELIDFANRAEAMRRYAQRSRLGMAAQNKCAELRLRDAAASGWSAKTCSDGEQVS